MGRTRRIAKAAVLLLVALWLAIATYFVSGKASRAEEEYGYALARTIHLVDPRYIRLDGTIPDDAEVEIEVFGPGRRAADAAKAKARNWRIARHCLAIATTGTGMASVVVGLGLTLAGLRRVLKQTLRGLRRTSRPLAVPVMICGALLVSLAPVCWMVIGRQSQIAATFAIRTLVVGAALLGLGILLGVLHRRTSSR